MKYRVRLDLSFDNEADAQSLMDFARTMSGKASSINEGSERQEISFCDVEICRHDEGGPCTKLDRLEVRKPEQSI
jgi:hypothetical protein